MTAARGLVVDADAHVRDVHIDQPPGAWRALAELHPGWIRAGESGGRRVTEVLGKHYPHQTGRGRGVPIESATSPAAAEGARDLSARIRDLDAEGIDVQVLYGGLALAATSFDDQGFARDFCRVYNDWLLADVCAAHPGRLRGAAALPLRDAGAAAEEVGRAAGIGAVAVSVPAVVGDRTLDDPSLLPVLEAVAHHGLALAVHGAPGMNVPLPAAGLFDNYAQVHTLSFPVDAMVAFTALVMGGVLDRLPSLRVAFLESGVGWVPYLVHRAEEHRHKRGDLIPGMLRPARDYVERGQCFFTFECEDPLVDVFVRELGDGAAVFASDYPHWDSDFPGTVAEARSRNAALGEDALARLMGGNAVRLYALDEAAAGRAGTGSAVTAAP